ncbi:MAG: tetratricopeptide repeat protein [Cyanobacteriota bacterium]
MISIGTIQFAVNTEENSHLMAEHPIGSISRMIAEMLSEKLSFLGIISNTARLIVTKPNEINHKQVVYDSMLAIETAKKILKEEYFDYCLYGQINFKEVIEVEISLLDSRDDKSLWRRVIKERNNNFLNISTRIIEEVSKILDLEINLNSLSFLDSISSNNLKAWGWYSLFYEDELSFEDRKSALLKAIELDNNFIFAKLKLISLKLSEEKDVEKALNELEILLEKIDKSVLNFLAKNLIKQEKYYAANIFYDYSLKKDPNQTNIFLDIMKISEELKNNDKLKFFINKYIELTKPENINYEKIGYFFTASGNMEKALEILIKADDYNIKSGKIYSMIAFIYLNKNDFKKASLYYEKSFSLIFSETILEDWSASLLQTSDYNKVIDVIEKYRDDFPHNSGIECNLAIAYLNLKNKDKAIKILDYCVKKDKDNPKAAALLGNLYFEQKSYTRAQKYIIIASKKEPNNFYWQKLLGDLYFETGDFLEAEKYYLNTISLKNDIRIPKYIFIQAEKDKNDKKYLVAIKKYYSAYSLDSSLFKSIEEIYNIFVLLDEIDNGIDFFENILEKNIDKSLIWLSLHKLYQAKAKGFFAKKWKNKSEVALDNYNDLIKKS